MAHSAEIFSSLEKVAILTGDQVFTSLLPGCRAIFGVVCGITLLWTLIEKGLIQKSLTLQDMYKPLLAASIIGCFLSGANYYKEWFFEPLYQTGNLLLQTVLQKTSLLQGGNTTIQGSLKVLEAEIEKIITFTQAISSDSAFYRVDQMFLAFALRVAFEFLWLLYLSFAVEYIFGLMIVTALAPLIIVCLGFEKTRSMGVLLCKIPVHGALTLVLGSLALSFLFTLLRSSIAQVPLTENGLGANASQWVYTTGYDTLIILVLLSGLFLMKAAQYVSSFLHISVGVGANAAIAGIGAVALSYAKQGAVNTSLSVSKILSKVRGG